VEAKEYNQLSFGKVRWTDKGHPLSNDELIGGLECRDQQHILVDQPIRLAYPVQPRKPDRNIAGNWHQHLSRVFVQQ
jgi:hypothetical protein